jgi:hypothetical protein
VLPVSLLQGNGERGRGKPAGYHRGAVPSKRKYTNLLEQVDILILVKVFARKIAFLRL